MTKQVALSEAAYAALRRAKSGSDSFSDTVLRLLREAEAAQRDPFRFASFPHRFRLDATAHLRQVEADRDSDRADALPAPAPPQAKRRGRRRA